MLDNELQYNYQMALKEVDKFGAMDEYSEFFREIKRYDDDYAQKNE